MNQITALVALCLTAFILVCPASGSPFGPTTIDVAAAKAAKEPLDALVKDVEHRHPAAMFILAKRLFDAGRRDEAVFWFFEGQLRWRALMASASGPPIVNGEQDHFAVLFSEVGPDINHYAFGDIPALLKTIDRVIAWDASHPDDFAKGKARDDARAGLKQFEAYLLANEDMLVKKRAEEMRLANAGAVPGDPYSGTGGVLMGTPSAMLVTYDPRTFARFREGATTKAEIVKALGRPEAWTTEPNGVTHITYSYSKPTPTAASVSMEQRVMVSFTFNSKRVLTAINLPKGQ